MKHQFSELNGLQFHYVVDGEPGAKTILFLHGFPEFWYEWRNLLSEFGRDHFAVAPDLRGYNLSEKPAEVSAYSVRNLVADIKAFFDQFSPQRKAILVAHDWGGAVAWAFAIAYPEYLEALVIINAPHPGVFARELANNPAQQRASAYMLAFRGPDAEAMLSRNDYAALSRALFDGSTRPDLFTEEDRKAYRTAWSQPGALTGGLNYYRASRLGPPANPAEAPPSPFVEERSLEVKVPTLVIWGEKDTALLDGNLNGLDEYVRDLTIVRVPGASHWIVHEESEAVCQHIREFLTRDI